MSKWKPMESAPKDGQDVVGLGHLCADEKADGLPPEHWITRWFNPTPANGFKSGWYRDDSLGTPYGQKWEPTHWIPIPEYPDCYSQ